MVFSQTYLPSIAKQYLFLHQVPLHINDLGALLPPFQCPPFPFHLEEDGGHHTYHLSQSQQQQPSLGRHEFVYWWSDLLIHHRPSEIRSWMFVYVWVGFVFVHVDTHAHMKTVSYRYVNGLWYKNLQPLKMPTSNDGSKRLAHDPDLPRCLRSASLQRVSAEGLQRPQTRYRPRRKHNSLVGRWWRLALQRYRPTPPKRIFDIASSTCVHWGGN